MSNLQKYDEENKFQQEQVVERELNQNNNQPDISELEETRTQQSNQMNIRSKGLSKVDSKYRQIDLNQQALANQPSFYLCCLIEAKRDQLSIFNIKVRSKQQVKRAQSKISEFHPQPSQIKQVTQDSNKSDIDISRLSKIGQLIANEAEIYCEYRCNIMKSFSAASGRRRGSEEISYSTYKRILTVWEKLDQKTRTQNVGIDNFLKFSHLSRLMPGAWLNDVIMSAYIKLLQTYVCKFDESHSCFVIFDSLKAGTIFDREDSTQIQRLLYKHSFEKYKTIPILLINMQKHWFFTTVELTQRKGTQTLRITIFDSLAEPDVHIYLKNKFIAKLRTFFDSYYNTKSQISVCLNYPRQINGNDCGVIALCGIKDIIRQRLSWSFHANQMNYRRALITKELIDARIVGI